MVPEGVGKEQREKKKTAGSAGKHSGSFLLDRKYERDEKETKCNERTSPRTPCDQKPKLRQKPGWRKGYTKRLGF